MPKDTKGNTFYLNNYINWDQFNQLYDLEWQTKGTRSANAIVQKLVPTLRKAMEQRQEAGIRVTQMKKTPRRMNNGSLDQHKQNDYDTDELQDSQYNGEANPDEMEDLNIGY